MPENTTGGNGPMSGTGMPTKTKIRIVVADDHPIFRDGLCKLLALEEDKHSTVIVFPITKSVLKRETLVTRFGKGTSPDYTIYMFAGSNFGAQGSPPGQSRLVSPKRPAPTLRTSGRT